MVVKLTEEGKSNIQKTLENLAKDLPGCFFSAASADEILFDGCAGRFDVLDESPDARQVSTDDVVWFASTTKLLTAVCTYNLSLHHSLSITTLTS